MTFYTDPAFFVLLAIAVLPAIGLGIAGKPLRLYGFCVSVVFLGFLFSKDLKSLAAFIFYLVLSTAVTMVYLRLRGRENPPKAAYPIALVAVLAPLIVYKVGAVFDQNILGFLGISYITFKAAQVVLEIHDGLIKEFSPLDYLYTLVFFPSFTSGPILRSRAFVEDIHTVLPRGEYIDLLRASALRFVVGAFYKFVCSSLFSIAMWAVPRAIGTSTAAKVALGQVGEAWAYALFLFFDFAGYSLMAVGVGGVLGVHVPQNFRAPFLSVDIKDFWNRWHISLSWWLRDYVFMRVVRIIRRKKLLKSRLAASCAGYVVNMTLMGLWHGITPNYFVYGVYHGVLLSLNEVFQKSAFYKRHKDSRAFKVCSWFVTMNLVVFGMALFSGQVHIG